MIALIAASSPIVQFLNYRINTADADRKTEERIIDTRVGAAINPLSIELEKNKGEHEGFRNSLTDFRKSIEKLDEKLSTVKSLAENAKIEAEKTIVRLDRLEKNMDRADRNIDQLLLKQIRAIVDLPGGAVIARQLASLDSLYQLADTRGVKVPIETTAILRGKLAITNPTGQEFWNLASVSIGSVSIAQVGNIPTKGTINMNKISFSTYRNYVTVQSRKA